MIRSILLALTLVVAAPVFAAELVPGAVAPDFSLSGADGQTYKLSQFKGKIVVLEWFNKDCPYVHKFYDTNTMQTLQKKMVDDGVVWLTIASNAEGKEGFVTPKTAPQIRLEKKMANTALLLDTKQTVARAYSAKTTPHMFVIDTTGTLAYEGAMDDHASAGKDSLKGATNFVEAAVASVKKHEKVKMASTVPYGCSVKY